MRGFNFKNILSINVRKCHGGKNYVFGPENFKVVRILLSGTWSLPIFMDIPDAMNTINAERHNDSENSITVNVSRRTQKVEIYLANGGSGLAFLSTNL